MGKLPETNKSQRKETGRKETGRDSSRADLKSGRNNHGYSLKPKVSPGSGHSTHSSAGGGSTSHDGRNTDKSKTRNIIRSLVSSKRTTFRGDRNETSRRDTIRQAAHEGASKVMHELGETVTTVVISEDMKIFAAGAMNNKAIVCDVGTGDIIAEFKTDGQITASALGMKGVHARLIVGTFSGMIVMYHISSNRQEYSMKFCNGEMVTCLALGRQSTRLAVGGKSTYILLYALSLSEEAIGTNVLHSFNVQTTGTLSLSLDATASMLVSGGEDKIVNLWQVPTDQTVTAGAVSNVATDVGVHRFRATSIIHSVALDATGLYLAVGTSEHTQIFVVRQYDEHILCEPLMILECAATQGGVAFSHHAQVIIGGNQLVSTFDLETGGMLVKMEREHRVRSVAISQDGRCLVVGGFDKRVQLFQLNRGATFSDVTSDPKSQCKSVCLTKDSTLLAMGLDIAGKGEVALYNATKYTLIKKWEHSKPMWAVRFSTDGAFLAAAGWDMALTLYSTTTYAVLQQIKYTPLGGPAFIWSLEWSSDSSRLALGCWNTHTYLYSFRSSKALLDSPPLTEISQVKRGDRVYAVALDATGGYMVIGGRDKRVAMYDTDRGDSSAADEAPVEAVEMWDVPADDFVYCIAMTSDMQYVAYGGTAKKVSVLSAMSGTTLFEVPQSGVIWSVTFFSKAKTWSVAIGGELPVLTLVNVETQADELCLPVAETTNDICVTQDSIVFCNGNKATAFGSGGTGCSWQESPSFGVVSGMVLSLLSTEDQLIKTMQIIIDRHPAVINAIDEFGSGGSLLHFIIERTNQPALLSRLLNANCTLSLPRDYSGRSPFQLAVQHGKWRALQLLVDAVINKRFAITPGPMALVNESMRSMAYKYPLYFLSFISSLELQPEPEVLGDIDASDVMLPTRLLIGSWLRCPKGAWDEQLQEHRLYHEDDEGPAESAPTDGKVTATSKLTRTKSMGALFATAAKQVEQTQKAEKDEEIPVGYSTVVHTGVQAYRVPLEDFAAIAEPGGVCPLQLIVDAVSMAHGPKAYSVFGSQVVDILLDFKWKGFAQRKYLLELILYLVHVVIILIWNLYSQQAVEEGYSLNMMLNEINNGGLQQGRFILLAIMWVWTSMMCLLFTRLQTIEVMLRGVKFFRDPWNMLEMLYIVFQIAVNVLFLTHDRFENAVTYAHDVNATNPFRRLDGLDDPLDGDVDMHMRMLKGAGGGVTGVGGFGLASGRRAGAYVVLQALVALTTWFRLLYYFKGILRLGTLVHTLQRIVVDIYPLLILILVIFIAFWSSLYMLLNVELVPEDSPEWYQLGSSIHKMINMGLYTDMDTKLANHERDPLVLALYEAYMFIMQIVLLNMLIALMAESNERVRQISKLVARFERAKLILIWERRLADLPYSNSPFRRLMRFFAGLPTGKGSQSADVIFPKWLHVLMPGDDDSNEGEGENEGTKALRIAQESGEKADEGFSKLQKSMSVGQEETKRLSTLMVETQEKHANMLRDLQRDVAALAKQRTSSSFFGAPEARGSRLKAAAANAPEIQTSQSTTPIISSPRSDTTSSHTKSFGWLAFLSNNERGNPSDSARLPTMAEKAVALAPPKPLELPPKVQEALSVKPPVDSVRKAVNLAAHVDSARKKLIEQSPRVSHGKTHEAPVAPANGHGAAVKLDLVAAPAKLGSMKLPGLVPSLSAVKAVNYDVPIPVKVVVSLTGSEDPNATLKEVMSKVGLNADLARAEKAATRIRSPNYSLREFHDDIVAAFPELQLYLVETDAKASFVKMKEEAPSPNGQKEVAITSGSDGGVEYLRTMGAFFAIYWLARIGIDGERGFCFGVNEHSDNWRPMGDDEMSAMLNSEDTQSFVQKAEKKSSKRKKQANDKASETTSMADPQAAFFMMSANEKAISFLQTTEWKSLAKLLCDAGMLVAVPRAKNPIDSYKVVVNRMVGLLALTAIHDIMKVDLLLPTVQPEHAPYAGFKAGDRINDHDLALGYVLEHYGHLLPSYAQLPKSMQLSIRFTQVSLAFNHGWLVQAEAPPGHLLAQFKRTLETQQMQTSDIAFYFVHWLTDLAGAEPTPLRGSEKFVVKFPHPVLHSFISSFGLVSTLVEKTETQTFEQFLLARWKEVASTLGPTPTGAGAIALMRLIVHVQHLPLQQRLVSAWNDVDPDDAKVLAFEMALTGAPGQLYETHKSDQGGPSFLIYYGPAFMRVATRQDPAEGIRMLAEIYRQARSLWPFSASGSREHVTIRIDQIKDHSPMHIMEGYQWGEGWVLNQRNLREAVVEHHTLYMLQSGERERGKRLLNFWNQSPADDAEKDFLQGLDKLRSEYMLSETPDTTSLEA